MKRLFLLLFTAVLLSCSSDDNSIEDFTNVDYMKEFLIGEWEVVETKTSGDWRKYLNEKRYVFKEDETYEIISKFSPTYIFKDNGDYVLIPESGTLGATIQLHKENSTISTNLRVTGYGNNQLEFSYPGGLGEVNYRLEKIR